MRLVVSLSSAIRCGSCVVAATAAGREPRAAAATAAAGAAAAAAAAATAAAGAAAAEAATAAAAAAAAGGAAAARAAAAAASAAPVLAQCVQAVGVMDFYMYSILCNWGKQVAHSSGTVPRVTLSGWVYMEGWARGGRILWLLCVSGEGIWQMLVRVALIQVWIIRDFF